MAIPLKRLWKPLVQRAVTGTWRRLELTPASPAFPACLTRPGLYLHVPFCKNLCPYCPYNRVAYEAEKFLRYEAAVRQEVDLYAPHLAGHDFVSLYIGGGTPTVDLAGLLRIIDHIKGAVSVSGDICIELHPSPRSNWARATGSSPAVETWTTPACAPSAATPTASRSPRFSP